MTQRFAFSAMLAALTLLATGLLTGCSQPQPDEQEQALAQSAQRAAADAQPAPAGSVATINAGSCDATQAQWVVGKPIADREAEQARKDSSATSVRVLKPGQPVTMDFNASRLNIEVDAKGVGVNARCG